MKIKNMTDEQCLNKVLELLNERVTITTAFVQDDRTGNITHEIIQISCGEYSTLSEPQPLENPFRFASASEMLVTIN